MEPCHPLFFSIPKHPHDFVRFLCFSRRRSDGLLWQETMWARKLQRCFQAGARV